MANTMRYHCEPLNNNRFIVDICGHKIGFSSISDVELMNANVQVQEMSHIKNKKLNSKYVSGYNKTKKHNSSNTVILEKALMSDMNDEGQKYLLTLIKENMNIETISVQILRNDGNEAATLRFKGCKLKSFHISGLSASESGYIKQTLVFYYKDVTLVPK